MRYLGIDYGTKRIGIAISDEGGTMAFPYAILENSKGSLGEVKSICGHESVETIVVGESVDYKGQPNIVKKEIDKFIVELKKIVNVPIIEEREFLSTQQARYYQTKRKHVDDSAATIILQSYLDRKNNKPIMETLGEDN
ncbi:MAG: Holliday junction resolvase RuvX [Candidatus Paceibacterota bacterium]|jgi:putative Holliday junction resolvase